MTVLYSRGKKYQIDLANLSFLPNDNLDFWLPMLTTSNKSNNYLVESTSYRTDKPYVSNIKLDGYDVTVITSAINKNSKRQKGKKGDVIDMGYAKFIIQYASYKCPKHFAHPRKVIIAGNRYIHALLDWDNQFVSGYQAMSIPIDSKEWGEKIVKAVESKKFQDMLKSMKWRTHQTNYEMFNTFPSNWPNYFI